MSDRERSGPEVCNDCGELFDTGGMETAQCGDCEAQEIARWFADNDEE